MSARPFNDQVEQADDDCYVDPAMWPRTGIPDWITLSPVSDLAFRIYAIIKAHQSKEQPRPFPGQASLARMLGYAKTDQVSAAIQELRDIGAISSRVRPCPTGRRTHYTLHEMPAPTAPEYTGPRKTADLYPPGDGGALLQAMGDARARRKRGVARNPSGRAEPQQGGSPLTKVHPS